MGLPPESVSARPGGGLAHGRPRPGACPPRGADGRAPLTIVSLAAVTWDFALVGRTRMLTEAWLRMGQPTLFVQVPSLRTALERVRSWFAPGAHGAKLNFALLRPWPAYPASWWSRLGFSRVERAMRARARALRRMLERRL